MHGENVASTHEYTGEPLEPRRPFRYVGNAVEHYALDQTHKRAPSYVFVQTNNTPGPFPSKVISCELARPLHLTTEIRSSPLIRDVSSGSAHPFPAFFVRIAILSDIHSNLEALRRALEGVESAGVDAIYCLGDVVGYNADPAPCVELVRDRCAGVVCGNHDAAVAREDSIDALPSDGQDAARHNRQCLSDDQIAYLANLPDTLSAENCTFVHATPDTPRAWKRLTTYPAAQAQFDHFDTEICFIGHTHVPAVMSDSLGVLQVRHGHRYLVNVGSVGQPRDQNSKLSFGLFDTETFEYHNVRMTYDIDAAAQKIRDADALPNRLANRLYEGL